MPSKLKPKKEETIWEYSCEGDSTQLWACSKCGAAVMSAMKERHEEWHRER